VSNELNEPMQALFILETKCLSCMKARCHLMQ